MYQNLINSCTTIKCPSDLNNRHAHCYNISQVLYIGARGLCNRKISPAFNELSDVGMWLLMAGHGGVNGVNFLFILNRSSPDKDMPLSNVMILAKRIKPKLRIDTMEHTREKAYIKNARKKVPLHLKKMTPPAWCVVISARCASNVFKEKQNTANLCTCVCICARIKLINLDN